MVGLFGVMSVVVTQRTQVSSFDEADQHVGGQSEIAAGLPLYAYTQGHDLATCGRLAGVMAADVISRYGARPAADVRSLAARVL
jgi:sugar/nucleoside kinase (ribokinase family)